VNPKIEARGPDLFEHPMTLFFLSLAILGLIMVVLLSGIEWLKAGEYIQGFSFTIYVVVLTVLLVRFFIEPFNEMFDLIAKLKKN